MSEHSPLVQGDCTRTETEMTFSAIVVAVCALIGGIVLIASTVCDILTRRLP